MGHQYSHASGRPNLLVKISGVGERDRPWTVAANRWIVRETIAMFSPVRAMFASNFPVDRLCASFANFGWLLFLLKLCALSSFKYLLWVCRYLIWVCIIRPVMEIALKDCDLVAHAGVQSGLLTLSPFGVGTSPSDCAAALFAF